MVRLFCGIGGSPWACFGVSEGTGVLLILRKRFEPTVFKHRGQGHSRHIGYEIAGTDDAAYGVG